MSFTELVAFAPAIERDGMVEVIEPDGKSRLPTLSQVGHPHHRIASGACESEICRDDLTNDRQKSEEMT